MVPIPLILIVLGVIGAVVFFALPDKQPPAEPSDTPPSVTADENIGFGTVSPDSEMAEEKMVLRPDLEQLSPTAASATQTAAYNDGTYTATAYYFTPKRVRHEILVTLGIQDAVITSADVQYDRAEAKTPSHLGFDDAYRPLTVGVVVDDLDLSRVGGASLTTIAFNEALTDIKSDASSG